MEDPQARSALAEGRELLAEGCPLCAVLRPGARDESALTVAELGAGRLRLPRNQAVRGYCVLVSRRHVREPHELPPEERAAFFEDLARSARALEHVFRPLKLNYLILGNVVPHLHAHLVPRYVYDPAPARELLPDARVELLPEAQCEERAARLRAALEGASV